MRGKRLDIQGLRALAVLLVFANHLVGWPNGGFIGVDVFFVISGFLITGILLREHDRSGRISFVDFYRRRILRILPAALLVLVTTTLASAILLTGTAAKSVLADAMSALLFVSNWRFLSDGTDYFRWGSAPSPLQHFWSLSIEEQFYFVWPVVMALILALSARAVIRDRRWRPRIATGIVMALIVGTSFAWAMAESLSNPTVAYFSTLTRTWELGVGALLAIGAPALARLSPAQRIAMSYVGLAGILLSALVITDASTFPAPWALLPVASTSIVLASGVGQEARYQWVLSNPLSQYVGKTSYSLYLWHFPVIVLMAELLPDDSLAYLLACLVASLMLAAASYHLVENPLNNSPLLRRFSGESAKRLAFAEWRTRFSNTIKIGGVALLASALIFSVGIVSAISLTQSSANATQVEESVTASGSTASVALAHDIAFALNQKEWSELSPAASDAAAAGKPDEDASGCVHTDAADPSSCAFGDPANPTIVVLGDSLGIALLPTVRAAYGNDFHIRGLTMAACPLIDLDVVFDTVKRENECLAMREQAVVEIERLRPVTVFVINNYQWMLPQKLRSHATRSAASDEWADAARSTAAEISPHTGTVVFVSPPPEGSVIAECATRFSTPESCVTRPPETWAHGEAAESVLVEGNIEYLNTISWYCGESGRCPIFADGMPIKRDNVHPTKQWAERVAPVFREMTAGFVVGPR